MFFNRLSAVTPGRRLMSLAVAAVILGGCATPKPVDETAGWNAQ